MRPETNTTPNLLLSPNHIEIGNTSYSVEVLTLSEFNSRNLDRLHQLSYAQYRPDQKPSPIISIDTPNHPTDTHYIVAYSPSSIENSQTECSPDITAETKQRFSTTAGLYKLEFGVVQPTDSGLKVPIEADALIAWDGWNSNECVGYISSLSFNPLSSKSSRINITEALHTVGSQLAGQKNGGLNRILAIMAPNVARFAAKTGVEMTPLGGHLRWRDQTGNLTSVAQSVFLNYPGYWGTESTPENDRPILWQVSPGFPNKGKA